MTRRVRAVGIHLLASLVASGLAALVIYFLWYPYPYAAVAGGSTLLLLLAGVDSVLGPLITAIIAGPNKPWTALRRDLLVIVTIQLAAFAYGVYVIASARPVHLAFEVDLMRVVRAGDIETASLKDAPPALRSLPWTGPRVIATVKPTDPAEQFKTIELGLAGVHLAAIPTYWREYLPPHTDAAWTAARPATRLAPKYPQVQEALAKIAKDAGQPVDALRYLPLMSNRESWVVILESPGARPVGFLPVDGFF